VSLFWKWGDDGSYELFYLQQASVSVVSPFFIQEDPQQDPQIPWRDKMNSRTIHILFGMVMGFSLGLLLNLSSFIKYLGDRSDERTQRLEAIQAPGEAGPGKNIDLPQRPPTVNLPVEDDAILDDDRPSPRPLPIQDGAHPLFHNLPF
jgi:hypothetical protein